MQVKIGTGPDNWGVWFPSDPKQLPWERYLDEVAAAGYDLTELGPPGYLPSDPVTLRRELEKREIALEGGFTFGNMADRSLWPQLETETRQACETAAPFGAKFHLLIDMVYTDLWTGKQIDEPVLSEERWKIFIEQTQKLGEMTRSYGLMSVFHPHTDTHVQYEDQIERLLAETDPALVNLCLDTGHHAYRGGDPVAFMRKHYRRIPYLHLKSVDEQLRDKVLLENIPFALAVGMDMFCPPSRGVVDFKAFLAVLKEVDYNGVGIVEQDMYPVDSFDKPFPIAKHTREYLREIGMG